MVGRTLSHFKILEKIGAGGMGVVYRAVDLRLQRTVAIKILPPELLASPERRERFVREARAASALHHPNIVTVFEVDSVEDVDFIAMEFVEGRSLDSILSDGELELPRVVELARQVTGALARAHEKGIVHRDIKPQNIMVTPDETVKILDFGLAKHVGLRGSAMDSRLPTAEQFAPKTAEGTIVGTPHYMSPEQAQGMAVDERSDIFSFGAVLYEMLSGTRPFEGANATQVMSSILRDEPTRLRTIRRGLPDDLDQIVAKALQKDRDHRYQLMNDVALDLEELQAPAVRPQAEVSIASRMGARAVAIGLVLSAAFVGWWLFERWEWGNDRPPEFRLISTFAGSHSTPSFSPDGSYIAFTNDSSGVPQIWIKNLAGGDPIQITDDETPSLRPRWSPKNDQIVFHRPRNGIWSVPPLGGSPRRIVPRGRNPNWFADGERFVFEEGTEFWVARADGSDLREIEGVPEKDFYLGRGRFPAVSPQGEWVAFFQPELGPHGDLWLVATAGGEARQLTFDTREGGAPVWYPDGRAVLYSSARKGSSTLWRVPIDGGVPEPVTTGAGEDREPALSAEGHHLIYTNVRETQTLMLYDTASGEQRELLVGRTIFPFPMFSPSGDRIATFSWVGGNAHIFTLRIDDPELRQVTYGQGEINSMPTWSGDGSSVYFFRNLPEPSLMRIAADGGGEPEVVAEWKWETHHATREDPNGRYVAYVRHESGSARSTVIHELKSQREWPLALPLRWPRWSRDSQHIIGGHYESGNVAQCPISGEDCTVLAKGFRAAWSGDESKVYILRHADTPEMKELWSLDLATRTEAKLTDLGPFRLIDVHFDLSIDDQVVWTRFQQGKQELWLVEMQ